MNYLSGNEQHKQEARTTILEADRKYVDSAVRTAELEREFELLMGIPANKFKRELQNRHESIEDAVKNDQEAIFNNESVGNVQTSDEMIRKINDRFSSKDKEPMIDFNSIDGDDEDRKDFEFLKYKFELANKNDLRTGNLAVMETKKTTLKKRAVMAEQQIPKKRVKYLREECSKHFLNPDLNSVNKDEFDQKFKEYKKEWRRFLVDEHYRNNERITRNQYLDQAWDMIYACQNEPDLNDENPKFYSKAGQSIEEYRQIKADFDQKIKIESDDQKKYVIEDEDWEILKAAYDYIIENDMTLYNDIEINEKEKKLMTSDEVSLSRVSGSLMISKNISLRNTGDLRAGASHFENHKRRSNSRKNSGNMLSANYDGITINGYSQKNFGYGDQRNRSSTNISPSKYYADDKPKNTNNSKFSVGRLSPHQNNSSSFRENLTNNQPPRYPTNTGNFNNRGSLHTEKNFTMKTFGEDMESEDH